jgi:hypothetical protein
MRLKEYVDTLSLMPLKMPVKFANGDNVGPLTTWRGDYRKVTIPVCDYTVMSVAELLVDAAEVMNGREMIGYKGGEFYMNENTPVYADDYGQCTYEVPAGIVVAGDTVIIATYNVAEYVEWM